MTDGRPAPARRFLHRPLWWLAGTAIAGLIFLANDVRLARSQERFSDAHVVVARAAPNWDGEDPLVDLEYVHPQSGAVVRAATWAEYTGYLPQDRSAFEIDVSRSDPSAVRLASERRGPADELPYYAVPVVIAVAFAAARWWHVRRCEHLITAPTTGYAMQAVVVPPTGWHRRWRLFLYPVDAVPGDAAVCGVALIAVPSYPTGTFDAEVKGGPRPFGIVVVRSGDDVLWTRGRALGRARWPMPRGRGELVPRVPPTAKPLPGRRPSPVVHRALLGAGVATLVLAQLAGVSAVDAKKEVLDRSRPVTATVTSVGAVGPEGVAVTLSYELDGRLYEGVPHVGLARAPTPGTTVAMRADTDRPKVVWSYPDEPTPTEESLGLAALLSVGLLLGVALVVMGVRRAIQHRQVVGAEELLSRGRLELGSPPTLSGLVVYGARLQLRPAMAREGWLLGPMAGGAATSSCSFEPDGLRVAAIDAALPWSSAFPPTDRRYEPGAWWLRMTGGTLEAVTEGTTFDAEGPVDGQRLAAVRVTDREGAADAITVARTAALDPSVRTAFAEPGQLVQFVAARAWRHAQRGVGQPGEGWMLQFLRQPESN